MELREIRDLDGPNLFALEPVIKLEIRLDESERVSDDGRSGIANLVGIDVPNDPLQALSALVVALHDQLGLTPADPKIVGMDETSCFAVCFPWNRRAEAKAVARTAYEVLVGEPIINLASHLAAAVARERDDEDQAPTWVRDEERRIPTAAITGTNGKTTTTRFLAHILQCSGKRVGWSSSSGVYISGEMVVEGDYTGHGGARRVLTDPGVDCAVLETARGGILLRGLGYESNDVGVFLNVSEDHLDLQGVRSLSTLARVKATVVRTTRTGGVAVLNADDPIVVAQRGDLRAEVLLFTHDPANEVVKQHIRDGGRCLMLESGVIQLCDGVRREAIIPIESVPLTYGGLARHMVENSLAACAAAIGMGVELGTIREAMQTFHPDREHNAGRLNVFEFQDFTFIVDFAHNESGLGFLLDFARNLSPDASRLTAIIGTAGDRQESVFVGLGRIAGAKADRVLVKTNPGYLRGRSHKEMVDLVRSGLNESGRMLDEREIFGSEFDAALAAIDSARPGEVIVIMCVEDYQRIIDELLKRGARERTASASENRTSRSGI